MKQLLINSIKRLFRNTESTITTIIVLSLLGGSVGVLSFSKNLLKLFLQILNIPTPLWATIAVAFLVFVYLKILNNRSYKIPANSKSDNLKPHFGAYWDNHKPLNPYCPTCKSLLAFLHEGRLSCNKCKKLIRLYGDNNSNELSLAGARDLIKNNI